ncbi:MAG: DUF2064 domain-containing protein [bacterium]|nr:DUF2064 domain-containing protein [bacterium]
MSRRILAFLAKQPIPGTVKTRLVPSFSPKQAGDFYEAMRLDILEQYRNRTEDRILWYWPASSRAWFESRAAFGARLLVQNGDNLAARMAALFRVHAEEGYDRIVLPGTDSRTLPAEYVGRAFQALEHSDLVLCPDLDGVYNLIGAPSMRRAARDRNEYGRRAGAHTRMRAIARPEQRTSARASRRGYD